MEAVFGRERGEPAIAGLSGYGRRCGVGACFQLSEKQLHSIPVYVLDALFCFSDLSVSKENVAIVFRPSLAPEAGAKVHDVCGMNICGV